MGSVIIEGTQEEMNISRHLDISCGVFSLTKQTLREGADCKVKSWSWVGHFQLTFRAHSLVPKQHEVTVNDLFYTLQAASVAPRRGWTPWLSALAVHQNHQGALGNCMLRSRPWFIKLKQVEEWTVGFYSFIF